MSIQTVAEVFQIVFPDFETPRHERRKVRTNCKEIKRGIEGGGKVILNNARGRDLAYLPDTAETLCLDVDYLLKENGTELKRGYIRIVPEDAETEIQTTIERAIREINVSIYKNIIAQIIFTGLLITVIGVAISIGLSEIIQILELV